jgi:hypothetical protein
MNLVLGQDIWKEYHGIGLCNGALDLALFVDSAANKDTTTILIKSREVIYHLVYRWALSNLNVAMVGRNSTTIRFLQNH